MAICVFVILKCDSDTRRCVDSFSIWMMHLGDIVFCDVEL